MISLLPGPVEIAPEIEAAFHRPPIYHRSAEFTDHFEQTRARLARMTRARYVAILNGSGTLANEVVASCLNGPGIILVNGEFGARLAGQARRWNLPARVIEWAWGTTWDFDRIDDALSGANWIWAVHLETSTGMLNDIARLGELARNKGVRLCLDCVSSLGAVPLDLSDVWLASGVSGKALGSYAGVAIVFAQEKLNASKEVPTYLDLTLALRTEGPCFTFPSPLLLALEAALQLKRDYAPLARYVRERLREIGTDPLVQEMHAAPTVTTFVPPTGKFLDHCRSLGYEIGGRSSYLAARGLVQIANMGAVAQQHIDALFDGLQV